MNAFRSGNAARTIDLLPPDRPASRSRSISRPVDVQDADFEVIAAPRRNFRQEYNDNLKTRGADVAVGLRLTEHEPAFARAVGSMEAVLQQASPKSFAILVTCLCAPVFVTFAYFSQAHSGTHAVQPVSVAAPATTISETSGVKITSVSTGIERRAAAVRDTSAVSVEIISGGQKRTVSAPAQ